MVYDHYMLCRNERVFHIMSCLRFTMATRVTFVSYYVYHSVCSHGQIFPVETSMSCCSFVCAFDLSIQLQRRLSFPTQNTYTERFAIKGNICCYKNTACWAYSSYCKQTKNLVVTVATTLKLYLYSVCSVWFESCFVPRLHSQYL